MAQIEREYLHIHNGVEYLEFHYLDINGVPIDKEDAKKCTVYEYDKYDKIIRKIDCKIVSKMDKFLDRLGPFATRNERTKKRTGRVASLWNKAARRIFR